MEDKVNHPSHYTVGEIEVIKYIKDKLGPTEFVGYCTGNVLKYVSRWRHKGGIEDLKKAQVYLGWAVEAAKDEADKMVSTISKSLRDSMPVDKECNSYYLRHNEEDNESKLKKE